MQKMTPQEVFLSYARANILPGYVETIDVRTPVIRDRKFSIQPKDPSLKNLPDLLMKRQLGCKSNAYERKLLEVKTMNLKLTKTIDLALTCDPDFDEIILLKKGPRSLLVEYKVKRGARACNGTLITEIPHPFSPKVPENHLFGKHLVSKDTFLSDFCMGFDQNTCILYVGNNPRIKKAEAHVLVHLRGTCAIDGVMRRDPYAVPIWCCSKNNFTEKFALGTQTGFHINSILGSVDSRTVNDTVRGITFNEMGSLVFTALHDGTSSTSDMRIEQVVKRLKIDDYGLDEVVLTADENYLICGSMKGNLCKVDLRVNRKVVDYLGHVRARQKIPISISDSHNILCATGSDNVTRLWSLNDGGEPLNCLHPPTVGASCHSCLITDGFKVSVCMTQKEKAMLYEIFS